MNGLAVASRVLAAKAKSSATVSHKQACPSDHLDVHKEQAEVIASKLISLTILV